MWTDTKNFSKCFGFDGFKEFLLEDDKKALNKILYGIKKFEKKKTAK